MFQVGVLFGGLKRASALSYQKNSLLNQVKQYFSLGSSFKSRSKLSEFYKNVHPDILGNAPEKVKEENSRSLKSLNSYLDSLSQNQGVQQQKLVFYIPDKTNKKAKKYLQINVNLKEAQPNVTTETLQTHIDQTTALLLNELKEVRMRTNPFLAEQLKDKKENEEMVPEAEDEETIFKKYQQTMEPIKKHETFIETMGKKITEKNLGRMVFRHLSEYNHLKTVERIRQDMYDMDTPSQKPLLWARVVAEDTGYLKNSNDLFSSLIDPRLIYVDEKLTKKQLDKFLSIVMKDEFFQQTKAFQKIQEVFHHMEAQAPQLCLYITTKYSGSDMPGFFSIPFDFNPEEIAKQYEKFAPEAIQSRQEIDYLQNKVERLTKEIKNANELAGLTIPQANNAEEYNQQLLFLKKLKKILMQMFVQEREKIVKLRQKQLICVPKAEDIPQNVGYNDIVLEFGFKEEELYMQL